MSLNQVGADGHTSTEHTANSIFDDATSGPFSLKDLARLDEALTMASRETGLRFTLFIGQLGADTRATAEDLHARSRGDTTEAVLVAVSPGQRVLEVVTGTHAARRLPDRACALAVLSMTNSLSSGDLVGAIVNGLRQLSDQAGRPSPARH
ncbi:DUF5130 family protein [Modestobacter sp. I12A-02628]|uniref:DUF5130 family protein n=1 Tax=Goekera deserti TaxID=2497753 RepID=A0A7K3WDB8_9ACTN|nr:DUF5130 family protein [Goekera deserti]MPQ97377.1 DUF5130 family protein [Goekera deserti]NDI48022.1 DUF5130 family protein [Goekera deserti]NEL53770.1 DUF5130 family protein [Goekera deserti]